MEETAAQTRANLKLLSPRPTPRFETSTNQPDCFRRMQLLPVQEMLTSVSSRKSSRHVPTIKTGAIIFGFVVGAGLLVVILAGQIALSQLKVGGTLYEKLARDNGLISDLLPPPEYIVESYLEVALSLEKLGDPMVHRNRLTGSAWMTCFPK
jgi:hypothetical protein